MKNRPAIVLIILGLVGALSLGACGNSEKKNLTDAGNNGSTNNASNNGTQNNGTSNNGLADAGDENFDAAMQQPDPPYEDCDLTVWPQGDPQKNYDVLQGALFDVQDGQVVCLVDGLYDLEEEISLDTPNVEIRGESQTGTILDFSSQTLGANGLSVTSDGFTVARLTVRNTPGDAIRVTGANGVTFREVTVTWAGGPSSDNGAYGLYPVQCQNVLIENSSVSYASDAGIYVGQSQHIIVRNNEAFGNVAGIEIENSSFADVYDNHAHDNTGGILVFDLPSPLIQGGHANKIHNNRIISNNEPNFAEAGNIVAQVPRGTGLLVLASDENEIHDNVIEGNQSFGVAVVSFNALGISWDNPEFDPYAESNWVHDNTFDSNGTSPSGFMALVAQEGGVETMEDMLWDGYIDPDKDNSDGSLTNCFSSNTRAGGEPATYRMIDAEGGFKNQSTELGDNACEGQALEPTEL